MAVVGNITDPKWLCYLGQLRQCGTLLPCYINSYRRIKKSTPFLATILSFLQSLYVNPDRRLYLGNNFKTMVWVAHYYITMSIWHKNYGNWFIKTNSWLSQLKRWTRACVMWSAFKRFVRFNRWFTTFKRRIN